MARTVRSWAIRSRDPNFWQWPAELKPLKEWLAKRNVDVHALKTARQALHFAASLSKTKIRYPEKGQEVPALIELQLALTGNGPMKVTKRQTVSYGKKRGTFGPASEVRIIDPTSYDPSEGAK